MELDPEKLKTNAMAHTTIVFGEPGGVSQVSVRYNEDCPEGTVDVDGRPITIKDRDMRDYDKDGQADIEWVPCSSQVNYGYSSKSVSPAAQKIFSDAKTLLVRVKESVTKNASGFKCRSLDELKKLCENEKKDDKMIVLFDTATTSSPVKSHEITFLKGGGIFVVIDDNAGLGAPDYIHIYLWDEKYGEVSLFGELTPGSAVDKALSPFRKPIENER